MDLANGQSRGLLHFLASRNFLLVPLVRSRENRERRGFRSDIPIVIPYALRLFRVDEILKTSAGYIAQLNWHN